MFTRIKLVVADNSLTRVCDGHWRYVIHKEQHEEAEPTTRADREHWLHRFVNAAVNGRLSCRTTAVQLVG